MLWFFLACNAPCDETTPCRVMGGRYYTIAPENSSADSPVVIMFHGWNGTPTGYAQKSEIRQLSEFGIRVVLPEGQNKTWNVTENPLDRNDLDFALKVLDDAADRFQIDETKIYASGFSMGAAIASMIGCQHPDRFAAIAPTSGGFFMPVPANCVGPISVRHEHGLSDRMWPIEGRTLWEGFEQSPIEDNIDLWSHNNGCSEGIELVEVDDDRSCRILFNCEGQSEVVKCTHERGHVRLSDWGAKTAEWLLQF